MAYIEWKGKRSDTIPGLIICELPPISKPKMRTSITKIDGRDGDIIEELGYESYTKNVKIGLTRNYDIDTVAKYFTGEGTIVLSYDWLVAPVTKVTTELMTLDNIAVNLFVCWA